MGVNVTKGQKTRKQPGDMTNRGFQDWAGDMTNRGFQDWAGKDNWTLALRKKNVEQTYKEKREGSQTCQITQQSLLPPKCKKSEKSKRKWQQSFKNSYYNQFTF